MRKQVMNIEIKMPSLSPTMEKGTMATWLKTVGDPIQIGDVVAEIESDKTTVELEATGTGYLSKIHVQAGEQDVPVETVIGIISTEPVAITEDVIESVQDTINTEERVESPPILPSSALPEKNKDIGIEHGANIKVSPLAKRIAGQLNVSLADINGTGPNGKIIRKDVEAAAGIPNKDFQNKAPIERPAIELPDSVPYELTPINGMRKSIAERLSHSKQTVPHFYMTIECVIDELLAFRKLLNNDLSDSGSKLSVNDFVIKAAAKAAKKVPQVNAMWVENAIAQFDQVDISVAVAIDSGLVTPVVKKACLKGLSEISNSVKELAHKAKCGKLMPDEYSGGTITISNLGMFGIEQFQAVINPPQSIILGIGSGKEVPVVKDGEVQIATVVKVTLSADHRVVDGAVGAAYLNAFKSYMENPRTMLL